MNKLSRHYEVLAFDWPGMGGSDAWNGGCTPKSMGDRIAVIMKELNIESANLVAHDMGAQAALVCAAEHPQLIESVCISNSLLIHDAETSWEIKYLRNLKLNKFVLTYLPRIVFARALGTFEGQDVGRYSELKDEFWSFFKKEKVRKYIIRMCFGYQAQLPRLGNYYSKIICPILAIWSQGNKHFSVHHAECLKEIVPKLQLEVLEVNDHWLALTKSEECSQIINNFLGK